MTVTDTAPADLTSLTYLPWCRPSAWDDRPCVEDDGGSLTYADFGDRVDAAAEQRFGFPLVEGYGLTEGTCVSTLNPVDGPRKVGTVGLPLPGQRVAVMAPDGTLLPPGERGEVVIQGANVMRGYLGRPDATAESLGDGWLHTGDVGVLDEDGYLRLVDRIKDMIIRGGENLYPKEIEAELHAHPAVLEAAVVGAAHDLLGEVPVAYVSFKPGASARRRS